MAMTTLLIGTAIYMGWGMAMISVSMWLSNKTCNALERRWNND
jgi:hypothetical protein